MKLATISEADIGLPAVHQQKVYNCGAALVRCMAEYAGVQGDRSEIDFAKLCNTNAETGTLGNDILKALHTLDIEAEERSNLSLKQLFQFIKRKYPVICLIQAHGNNHFVAVIGNNGRYVHFEDPALYGRRGRRTHQQFERQWTDNTSSSKYQRYGIVVKVKRPHHLQSVYSYQTT